MKEGASNGVHECSCRPHGAINKDWVKLCFGLMAVTLRGNAVTFSERNLWVYTHKHQHTHCVSEVLQP